MISLYAPVSSLSQTSQHVLYSLISPICQSLFQPTKPYPATSIDPSLSQPAHHLHQTQTRTSTQQLAEANPSGFWHSSSWSMMQGHQTQAWNDAQPRLVMRRRWWSNEWQFVNPGRQVQAVSCTQETQKTQMTLVFDLWPWYSISFQGTCSWTIS